MTFECLIAGEGPERRNLESLIRRCGLEERVTLLGHVPREHMDSLYDRADVVVLTSRSEGIPLVLMEAMARGKIVLAPAITGIPELVIAGRDGISVRSRIAGGFRGPLALHSFADGEHGSVHVGELQLPRFGGPATGLGTACGPGAGPPQFQPQTRI